MDKRLKKNEKKRDENIKQLPEYVQQQVEAERAKRGSLTPIEELKYRQRLEAEQEQKIRKEIIQAMKDKGQEISQKAEAELNRIKKEEQEKNKEKERRQTLMTEKERRAEKKKLEKEEKVKEQIYKEAEKLKNIQKKIDMKWEKKKSTDKLSKAQYERKKEMDEKIKQLSVEAQQQVEDKRAKDETLTHREKWERKHKEEWKQRQIENIKTEIIEDRKEELQAQQEKEQTQQFEKALRDNDNKKVNDLLKAGMNVNTAEEIAKKQKENETAKALLDEFEKQKREAQKEQSRGVDFTL